MTRHGWGGGGVRQQSQIRLPALFNNGFLKGSQEAAAANDHPVRQLHCLTRLQDLLETQLGLGFLRIHLVVIVPQPVQEAALAWLH